MKKAILQLIMVLVAGMLLSHTHFAQGVGINTTGASPDPSAILDASSTTQGFLLPRMTTTQRNNIISPALGLQIFNLDTDCLEMFFGNGGWKPVQCGCTSFPDASFANPGGAANVPVSFSANTIVGTHTYSWSFGQGSPNTSSNSTENVTWATAGTYSVSLTVTDINNCSASLTQNVTIIQCASFPNANFTGSNGSVNSPIAFSANGSGPGYTYAWSFPSGTPSTSSSQNPTVQWATAGTYTVSLTVTDNLGCSATQTLSVSISLCTPETWNFTNCGQTGRFGPTQIQCNSAYSGTNLSGQVTINTQGIQEWTVPANGTYRLTAAGAQGGANGNGEAGGLGAVMSGEFNLSAGEVIGIIAGQIPNGLPSSSSGGSLRSGGGGGGSFIVNISQSNQLLMAAGAGGGRGEISPTNINGTNLINGLSGVGGMTTGAGGVSGAAGGGGSYGQGAAGWSQNGNAPVENHPANAMTPPNRFLANGTGGEEYISSATNRGTDGGFGGGGSGWAGGGGGGGYSGGGGGGWSGQGNGGGGGSFNSGTNQTNTAGTNSGNGYVTIQRICP